jgi:flavin reductase (DIM6/NTAB) family NADH-FMN oxidoreductase RutF
MSEFLSIHPGEVPTPQLHQHLLGVVAPRPIAFVSTLSPEGIPNLAPYSFFNVFSSRPPIAIFSSNRRVRDNTTKDTLANVLATGEAVINAVSYDMVYQMSLASVEYPAEVNEFEKSGLTPLPSELVRPFRVAESPAQMECRVQQVIPLGEEGGAGNLIVCEIVRLHIRKDLFDGEGRIDPHKADLMARMGRAFYCRASGANVFPLPHDVGQLGIGVDQLPASIRLSEVLTGNDLARLASVPRLPEAGPGARLDPEVMNALAGNAQDRERRLHLRAQALLREDQVQAAWQVLLAE